VLTPQIVGDMNLVAKSLGTDVVDFEGYVPPNKMHRVYDDSDVLVGMHI